MLAFEMSASITNHRVVVQDDALPDNASRRSPPPVLAGKGTEAGDIINSVPSSDWGFDKMSLMENR